jgi:hypothetical protein
VFDFDPSSTRVDASPTCHEQRRRQADRRRFCLSSILPSDRDFVARAAEVDLIAPPQRPLGRRLAFGPDDHTASPNRPGSAYSLLPSIHQSEKSGGSPSLIVSMPLEKAAIRLIESLKNLLP